MFALDQLFFRHLHSLRLTMHGTCARRRLDFRLGSWLLGLGGFAVLLTRTFLKSLLYRCVRVTQGRSRRLFAARRSGHPSLGLNLSFFNKAFECTEWIVALTHVI